MTSDLIEFLACPSDAAWPLTLSVRAEGTSGEIREGALVCPNCGRSFPIEDGIPRLLPDPRSLPPLEAREKESERRRRDAEATLYDRNLLLQWLGRWEIPATLNALALRADDCLVEVGCGTGRFTHRVATSCRRVLAIDFSAESLRVARDRTETATVDFIQADASYLPLRDGVADRALSCQMLEHLPTAEARERAIGEVARALRPRGSFVTSAYWYSPLSPLLGGKQGHHSGEIYFYRFTREEFVALLGNAFEVTSVTARLIYILLARGTKRGVECPSRPHPPRIEHERPSAEVGPTPPHSSA